jgi:hypothetical protein
MNSSVLVSSCRNWLDVLVEFRVLAPGKQALVITLLAYRTHDRKALFHSNPKFSSAPAEPRVRRLKTIW